MKLIFNGVNQQSLMLDPMQVYNDRRVYPGGGGPALGPGENFVPAATASAATGAMTNDRRAGRGRSADGRNGKLLFSGLPPMKLSNL